MRRFFWAGLAIGLAVATAGVCATAQAQDKNKSDDLDLSLHARAHATAMDVGLPAYPGAVPYKSEKDSGSSLDAGLAFGNFHVSLIVAGFETSDSAEQVLKFYRKPLSRYGQVLECNHGKPVGKLAMTDTGLSCSDDHGNHVQVNGSGNSSDGLELRAGSPHKYRMVGIDSNAKAGETHFALVYLETPRDKGGKAE